MMVSFEASRCGTWFVGSARARTQWYAWAKRGELETDDLLYEPGDVWFQRGATREEAIAKVVLEVLGLEEETE